VRECERVESGKRAKEKQRGGEMKEDQGECCCCANVCGPPICISEDRVSGEELLLLVVVENTSSKQPSRQLHGVVRNPVHGKPERIDMTWLHVDMSMRREREREREA
jgi:hypothetical protein